MYELVWTVPMRTLSKGFGISDVALRKRCVRAAVPVPPSGYWTQLRCGHNPARLPLPPRPLEWTRSSAQPQCAMPLQPFLTPISKGD
jgi:hypothetical protein